MATTASLTALACALALCAWTPPAIAQAVGAEEDGRCVTLRNVNGYQVIDDRHLVLTGGASRYYLVTTRSRCSGLSFGAQIGTSFGDNARLCEPMVEYVIPDDGWRCAIDTVREVDSLEEARQIAAQGESD
ncbi:MAG: DUF6491 family protein [Oceanicaulis sp.]